MAQALNAPAEIAARRVPPGWIVHPPIAGAKKTFCVLGVARGGTSMVSGLLGQLGVPMGENLDTANQEDRDFTSHGGDRELFSKPSTIEERAAFLESIRRLVGKRNRKYDVWGWKDPVATYYVHEVLDRLRNPHFVLILRDPGAVAIREMLYAKPKNDRTLFLLLERCLKEYRQCGEFLFEARKPTLVISYERALRYPRETVGLLSAFVHAEDVAATHSREVERLAAYIQPERLTADVDAPIIRREHLAAHDAGAVAMAGPIFGRFDSYGAALEIRARQPTPADREFRARGRSHLQLIEEIYARAAQSLLRGDRAVADILAARCMLMIAQQHPVVKLGPVAVGRAVDVDFEAVQAAPDVLTGCFNIRGLVLLLGGDAVASQDYFEAGYLLARRQLEEAGPSLRPVSAELVWWLAFHAALAARNAGRVNAQRRHIDALSSYLRGETAGRGERLNRASAQAMYARAKEERLV